MTKQELLDFLKEYEEENDKLPTRDSIREKGLEYQFTKEFGSFSEAKFYYLAKKDDQNFEKKKLDSKDVLLEKLKNQLSEFEIKTILESSRFQEVEKKKFHVALDKESFKFIAIGDTHIGHKKFREDWWDYMIDKGIEEEVDWMYHTGDIFEGMSNRPGHIYELSELGFEAQFEKTKSLFKDVPFPIKAITGNHDDWYKGKADQGIDVGSRLSEALDNFTYMGSQEADEFVGGVVVKMWHGNDGSQYSTSYRTQKFVENLTGGDKPNILLAGHAHKSIYHTVRNVSVFETGTLCEQTQFMRGRKLAAHTGFWIITVDTDGESIIRLKPEWFPLFK